MMNPQRLQRLTPHTISVAEKDIYAAEHFTIITIIISVLITY